MTDIKVFKIAPVVFTKDALWLNTKPSIQPGAIVLLPQDAVLYIPKEVEMTHLNTQRISIASGNGTAKMPKVINIL